MGNPVTEAMDRQARKRLKSAIGDAPDPIWPELIDRLRTAAVAEYAWNTRHATDEPHVIGHQGALFALHHLIKQRPDEETALVRKLLNHCRQFTDYLETCSRTYRSRASE